MLSRSLADSDCIQESEIAGFFHSVAVESGQRAVGHYVAARTNSKALEIDRKVKRAKWLRDFPVFETAHGHALQDAYVDLLRKHLDGTYDTHVKLVGDQQFLVDTAATCSFPGFEQACKYWLGFIDPDGKEPIDQIEKAFLRIGKGRGRRGVLTGDVYMVDGGRSAS